MKKQATKIAKKVLTVFLCVLISFGSIPLSGFVGLEFPDFPKIDFGFLKASAATKVLSENGEFYISSLNKSNNTASFAGVVDESVSFDDDFYHIPNKTQYNDEVYIITGIDNSAFKESGIKKVSIHSDITTIGDDAFKDCTLLETVVFEKRDKDSVSLVLKDKVFSGCTNLKNINFELSDVTKVGIETFSNCVSLEKIVLPDTLTESGRGMFYNCTSLNDVDLGGGITVLYGYSDTAIADDTGFFENCTNLKNIRIPAQVTVLEHNAFKNCTNLECVQFDDNSELAYIGGYSYNFTGNVFAGCKNLKSIIIPASVTMIGSDTFSSCTTLTDVIFAERDKDSVSLVLKDRVFSGCTNLKNINFELSNATKVGVETFSNCTSLEKIVLPDTLTKSGRGMFYNCTSLNDVDLGRGITVLYGYSDTADADDTGFFENCTNLKNIRIPAQVTALEHNAFKNCTNLECVQFDDNSELAYIGGYSYNFTGNVFAGCKNLKSIIIPASVTTIGSGAFRDCGLTNIVFSDTSKLTTIFSKAFYGTEITSITIPASVEKIEADAFSECSKLKNVVFKARTDDHPLVIGSKAFAGCTSLEHINLQDSNATTIKSNAFYSCKSLVSVKLPLTLKTLGASTFDKCGSIKLYMDTAEPEVLVTIIDEGWPFEIKETGIKDSEDRNLNSDNTYYKLSQKLSSGKTGVSLTLKYDFKETVKNNISNCNVSVKVPSTVAFNTAAVTVNGVKWSDVSTGSKGTVLNIKNVPSSGTIEFKVILTDASYFVSYAKIGYKLNNKSYNEVMGIINSVNDMITLNAPSETNKKDITVSGMASPEKNVDLYINGEYCKTVTTSKTGVYSENLTLPVSGSAETFNVEARINNGKNTSSASVLYSNDAVMITSAKMIYRGQEYDLLANQGKLPVISWSKGASFSFIIKVDNPEAVKAVYVVSQRAGGNNALLCEYNEDLDAYTATGFKGIVPCNFSVRCITDNNVGEYEDTIEQLGKEVENAILGSENITMTSNDNSTTIIVNENSSLSFNITENKDVNISITNEGDTETITVINQEIKYKTEDEIPKDKYTCTCSDNKKYYASEDENEVIITEDGIVVSTFKVILSATGAFIEETWSDVFETLCTETSLFTKLGIPEDLSVGGTNVNFFTALSFLTFIGGTAEFIIKGCKNELTVEDVVCQFLSVAALLPVVFSSVAFAPEVAISLWLISIAAKIILSDEFANFLSAVVKFIIDPSGIVYEAVPSNRVEGATVTALWIPYDENVPEFWSEDYPDLSNATVWNAEEYDQINPLKTLDDGSYSWEVPEGWWLVKAEKEGYVTTYSEWMDIPPERFDVNLALVSESAPEVDYINVYENEIEIAFTQYMDIESVNSENISILINGKPLEGVFNPKNEETAGIDQTSYASIFSFVPESAITGSADINISDVENYCGTKLEGAFRQRNNVVSKIESLSVPETVTAAINSDNSITVSAYPASAAAGKKVFLTLSNNLIATADCTEITLDENGQGIVNIHTELPGDVTISFTVENTELTESAVVIVDHSENTVQPEPEPQVFIINWVIDGISNEQFVEAGSEIIRPETPVKEGFAFIGWTPEIPDVMPSYDLTFTAVFEKTYICPDCGNEIRGEDAIREHIATEEKAKIKATIKIKNNNGSKTINYGETLKLTAVVTDKPADATIVWYVDGVKKSEGETFNVSFESGTKTVEVKLADSNGNVLRNASGNEIKDSESVTVKSGFFQKIISFFKNLFGMNRTVVQAIFKGEF